MHMLQEACAQRSAYCICISICTQQGQVLLRGRYYRLRENYKRPIRLSLKFDFCLLRCCLNPASATHFPVFFSSPSLPFVAVGDYTSCVGKPDISDIPVGLLRSHQKLGRFLCPGVVICFYIASFLCASRPVLPVHVAFVCLLTKFVSMLTMQGHQCWHLTFLTLGFLKRKMSGPSWYSVVFYIGWHFILVSAVLTCCSTRRLPHSKVNCSILNDNLCFNVPHFSNSSNALHGYQSRK